MKIFNFLIKLFSLFESIAFYIMIIAFLFSFSLSDNFPPLRYPKHGIFGWFSSLSAMKNNFNNKKILGFRSNTSEPDLSMIARDMAHYIKLHNLNISGRIAEAVDKYNPEKKKKNYPFLFSKNDCNQEYQNVYQLCRLTGVNLNLEEYGVPPEHVDILISNVIGYLPCGLFIIVLGSVTIIYYIIQLILGCFILKPSEHTKANVASIIFFYAGIALLVVSSVLYFCSFYGMNSLIHTLITLNSVVPRITSSLAFSLRSITSTGIPNALGPLIQIMEDIASKTHSYVNTTIDSFLRPTILMQTKMISTNESDLGVFSIYNSKIHPLAVEFYEQAKKYPKLENISKYFGTQDFSSYQDSMQDLLDKEYELASELPRLNSLFDYFNETLYPYKQYVSNLTYQEVQGTNKTVDQLITELEGKTIESFNGLLKLNENVKEKQAFYRFICAVFFIYGIVLVAALIFLAIMFMMHTRCSICVASTASIYAIIATILMFLVAVVFTGIGFADVELSNQLEPALDEFLTNIVGITIPEREIVFPQINITLYTNATYIGIINLSKIIFPVQMHNLEKFIKSSRDGGIADSLGLPSIADMNRYGDELGNFIIELGQSFSLPKIIVFILDGIGYLFNLIKYFPDSIDGFFNWEIPMTNTSNYLRGQIMEMDPAAMVELEPYLAQIDDYVDYMNSQYKIVLYQIYNEISDAFDKIDERLVDYIRSILNSLGNAVKHLLKNVYPILNTIVNEPIIGPYAIVRNFFCYDLASTSAYLSASATLMMFGLVVVCVLLWIRRKGMLPGDDLQIRRNKSNKLQTVGDENDRVDEV